MPGERPTRTESIFVRPNVLPPPRSAPFSLPSPCTSSPFSVRDSLRSHGTRLVSLLPLPPHHEINVINCSGSRYRISIRDETDDHLTRRTRTELNTRSMLPEKREFARKERALKDGKEGRNALLRSTSFLFCSPINSGGLIVNLFANQAEIDDHFATEASPRVQPL